MIPSKTYSLDEYDSLLERLKELDSDVETDELREVTSCLNSFPFDVQKQRLDHSGDDLPDNVSPFTRGSAIAIVMFQSFLIIGMSLSVPLLLGLALSGMGIGNGQAIGIGLFLLVVFLTHRFFPRLTPLSCPRCQKNRFLFTGPRLFGHSWLCSWCRFRMGPRDIGKH